MSDLQSVVEAVKDRASRKAPRSTVDLPLPIYPGQLAARFQILPPDAMDDFNERLSAKTVVENAEVAAEFVAAACRAILHRTDTGWEPITDNDRTITFDKSFAQAFGLELADQSAAAVVKGCWTLDDGTLGVYALDAFGARLMEWMMDTSQPVLGELLGESLGARPSNGLVEPQPTV